MGLKPLSRETCIVRKTDARKGRTESVSPSATATEWLHYGRVILDAGDRPLTCTNGDRETVFVCLKGGGTISAGASHWNVGRYDAVYVPRDEPIEVEPRQVNAPGDVLARDMVVQRPRQDVHEGDEGVRRCAHVVHLRPRPEPVA